MLADTLIMVHEEKKRVIEIERGRRNAQQKEGKGVEKIGELTKKLEE